MACTCFDRAPKTRKLPDPTPDPRGTLSKWMPERHLLQHVPAEVYKPLISESASAGLQYGRLHCMLASSSSTFCLSLFSTHSRNDSLLVKRQSKNKQMSKQSNKQKSRRSKRVKINTHTSQTIKEIENLSVFCIHCPLYLLLQLPMKHNVEHSLRKQCI